MQSTPSPCSACSVLRDSGRRSQYDAMRSAGFDAFSAEEAAGGGGHSSATPWGQPSMEQDDFDARFEAWWRKMGEE